MAVKRQCTRNRQENVKRREGFMLRNQLAFRRILHRFIKVFCNKTRVDLDRLVYSMLTAPYFLLH